MSPDALTARPAVRQFLRFVVVGLANTVVTLSLLWVLRDGFGWPVWLASAVGYAVGIVQGYVLNRAWTFAGGADVPVGPQMLRFVAVNIVMGVFFSGLTSLLAPMLGVRLASLVALAPVMIMSFLASRRFVFGGAA